MTLVRKTFHYNLILGIPVKKNLSSRKNLVERNQICPNCQIQKQDVKGQKNLEHAARDLLDRLTGNSVIAGASIEPSSTFKSCPGLHAIILTCHFLVTTNHMYYQTQDTQKNLAQICTILLCLAPNSQSD